MNTKVQVRPGMLVPSGVSHRFAANLFLRVLERLEHGKVFWADASGSRAFGHDGGLVAQVEIRDPSFYRRVLVGGPLEAARMYIEGGWDCSDLTALFRIVLHNESVRAGLGAKTPWLVRAARKLQHLLRSNTKSGSRANIGAHYDLGNDLFRLFLDSTLSYSSAFFEHPNQSLEHASLAKLDRLCRKLELNAQDHLVEIGTGWGGLAIHAAENYGCRVTTTTISKEQYDLAVARIAERGLSDRVTVLLKDYRDLEGQFSKLVSVEMIEAVGDKFLPGYFAKCSDLLVPGGKAAIQAITIPERRIEAARANIEFSQVYIFPGSEIPTISQLVDVPARHSRLDVLGIEDLTPHYAETLRLWAVNFERNLSLVRAIGYSEAFTRMWRYYLHYCEAAFRERHNGVVQVVYTKRWERA
ncbi:MAG: class I SAM-dependent methyltransferase [Deltaproteobacteria bacterium]|nr:class I SAM-dependent methyltransferase [Deltaproteobacteria bacterium]